jgi:hypothetical protein
LFLFIFLSSSKVVAPGLFSKIGDFFKKGFEFVKDKVVKPVAKTVKRVWDFAKPIAKPALQRLGQKYGIPTEVSDVGLDLAEGVVGKLGGETTGGSGSDGGSFGEEAVVYEEPPPQYKRAPVRRRPRAAIEDID